MKTDHADSLHQLYDKVRGAATLLRGLAGYEGVDDDASLALHLIADGLEGSTSELENILTETD